jgi:hypothetical protein
MVSLPEDNGRRRPRHGSVSEPATARPHLDGLSGPVFDEDRQARVLLSARERAPRWSSATCPLWTKLASPIERARTTAQPWRRRRLLRARRDARGSSAAALRSVFARAAARRAKAGAVGAQLAKTGEVAGLGREPAFLFRRGSARFAMSRVSRLTPRSREHFRAGATGRDALRGTRKPSACRLSAGRGPSPFVVPVAVPVTDRSLQGAGR